jgi:hypothetical protein
MANYALQYSIGQHVAYNEQPYCTSSRNDPNLILVHAKLFDKNMSVQRYINMLKNYSDINKPPQEITKLILQNKHSEFIDINYAVCNNPTITPLDSIIHHNIELLF